MSLEEIKNQSITIENVEIIIKPGILLKRANFFGFGLTIIIDNNSNTTVEIHYIVNYTTITNAHIRRERTNVTLPPNFKFTDKSLRIIDPPPINRITITMFIKDKLVQRSGLEIGPLIVLKNYEFSPRSPNLITINYF